MDTDGRRDGWLESGRKHQLGDRLQKNKSWNINIWTFQHISAHRCFWWCWGHWRSGSRFHYSATWKEKKESVGMDNWLCCKQCWGTKTHSLWHLACTNSYYSSYQTNTEQLNEFICTSSSFWLTWGCCFPGLLHQSCPALSSWFSLWRPPRCRLQPFALIAFGCPHCGCYESDKGSRQLWNLDADCWRQQKCPHASLLPLLLLIPPQRLRFCGWPRHRLATQLEKDGSAAIAASYVSKEETSFRITAAVSLIELYRSSAADWFCY